MPACAQPARLGAAARRGPHDTAHSQTIGMRQLLYHRQGLVDMSHGLLWVSQYPEGLRGKSAAAHTWIEAHAEFWSTALIWRIACDGFFQALTGSRKRTKAAPRHPKDIGGDDRGCGVVGALRQA